MKRIFFLLLIAVILSSMVFVGCKKDSGTTLSFFFFGDKKQSTDQVWSAIAEKFKDQLNVRYDIQFIAGTDYKDRMLVKLAAGDKWDLNFDGDWLQYYQAVAMNGYMALDDLLPANAPDLLRNYQSTGFLEAAKVNGKVVALPWTMVMTNRPFFQWRGDLIPEVDPSAIKTIEDIEQLLYALKQRYPDRYIVENVNWEVMLMKNDRIETQFNFAFNPSDPAIRVEHKAETVGYRERARLAEKWQRDGLIWADVLIDQLDHNQLIDQGRLITKFGTYEFALSDRPWVEPNAKWAYNALYSDKKFHLRTALANVMAIPRTAQNAALALKFMNILETSQEMFDLVQYGIEGVTYVKDSSKPNSVAFPSGMNAANSNYMEWTSQWALWKPQFMRGSPQFAEGFWQNQRDFAQSMASTIPSPLDGFNFNPEAVVNEIAQMQAIFDAAEKMLDVGLAGPADRAIDTLIADLNRAGLPAVKAEFQRQVDAWLASKR